MYKIRFYGMNVSEKESEPKYDARKSFLYLGNAESVIQDMLGYLEVVIGGKTWRSFEAVSYDKAQELTEKALSTGAIDLVLAAIPLRLTIGSEIPKRIDD